MPTAGAMFLAAGLAVTVWGGGKAVHGAKKAAKQAVCVVKTGHPCPKAKQ